MVIITFLLNILCEKNMSIVSWIIVFIPFIFTTYLTFLLVYLFGYNTLTGNLSVSSPTKNSSVPSQSQNQIPTPQKQKNYPKGSSSPAYQSGWYNFGII